MDSYQEFVREGFWAKQILTTQLEVLGYCTTGLAGEVGELLNIIKKKYFRAISEIPVEEVVSEMGDVLWYLVQLASEVGVTLEDVIQYNINKLKERRPEEYEQSN